MSNELHKCKVSHKDTLKEVLDLGLHPVSNRFLTKPTDKEFTASLKIGVTTDLGLIQIIEPMPAAEVAPRFDWLTYSEPEPHLDDLVQQICKLPGVTKDSRFLGISFKDDSTLERFKNLGYTNTWRIDPKEDLGIDIPGAGVETIQDRLGPKEGKLIADKKGKSDVIIVRHVLEHAYRTHKFVDALKDLVSEGGYIIFEVPDCTAAFDIKDYTTIWEEHILYFTPVTFKNCFAHLGLSVSWENVYPYAFENAMVAIVQVDESLQGADLSQGVLDIETKRVKSFAQELDGLKERIKECFADYKQNEGKIALFGAGHLACMFINLFELGDCIEFVVDDNPNKKNLLMPGSQLPIVGSKALVDENIKLCLLSLNPLSEDKVIGFNQEFIDRGGEFLSIFPASKRAMDVFRTEERQGANAV